MDDLNSQINQILNDPQSMAMLQNMAKSLGFNQNSNQNQMNNSENSPKLDLSQLASVFGQQNSNSSSPPLDMGMIMQVQNAIHSSVVQTTFQQVFHWVHLVQSCLQV